MYFYKADAFGFGGILNRPYHQAIETQASVVLSATGGRGHQRLDNVDINGIVSARLIECEVAGSYDKLQNGYASSATVSIEGLNVLNTLTADRIVARLACFQDEAAEEPAISAKGSHFENLRIAGDAASVDLDTEVFYQYSTFSAVEDAYKSGKLRQYVHGSSLEAYPYDHPRLRDLHEQNLSIRQSLALPGWFSLVRKVEGVIPETRNYGSVIYVPSFGIIHLAELLIHRHSRRLSMMRIELGSPVEGHLVFACAEAGTTDPGEGRPMKGRPAGGGR
jgi:hypothetical protein